MVRDSSLHNEGVEGEISSASLSYSEVFRKHLPYYLSIGMTPEEFWEGEVWLAKYYREADEYRIEKKNTELWLQGLYIYEAILDCSPILQAFAKSGTKPQPYSTEPYAITEKASKDKAEREKRKAYEERKARMEAIAIAFNKKYEQNRGD